MAFAVAACGGDSEAPSPSPGGGEPATAADGKALFTQNCANCHSLADANARGQVGPDLDQLRPGPDLVKTQTENGGGAMPSFKGKLTDAQIKAIADYVSGAAGT